MASSAPTFMPMCAIKPMQYICNIDSSPHASIVRPSLWATDSMESYICGLPGIGLVCSIKSSSYTCIMLTYAFHFFIVWWDIRHHRRQCWYYSMEFHTQCWQGLSHIRTLGWCCYRWRTECGDQPLQIGFHAANNTYWCHWRMSGYSLPASTSFPVIHRYPSTSSDTW